MGELSKVFSKTAKNIDKELAKYPDLEEVIVEEGNPDYISKEGLLFKKDGKKMIACPKGRTECRVPEGTTFIRNLQGCSKLKVLFIPKTVTDVGKQFFAGCSELEEVTIEGAKLKFKAEHFGKEGIPKGLLPKILDLAKNLSPDAITAFVLDNSVWKELPMATVVKLYLQYYSKTLEAHFDPVIGQIGPDAFSELMVQILQGKPAKKETEAAAEFLLQYGMQLKEQNRENLDDCIAGKEVRLTKDESDALEIMAGMTGSYTPLEQKTIEFLNAEGITMKDLETRLKQYFGLTYNDLPELQDLQGNTAPPFILACLLAAHEGYEKPGIRPEVEGILPLTDFSSLKGGLMDLVDKYLFKYQKEKKRYLSYPFCRYADEEMMAELTKRAPKWRTTTSGDNASPLREFRKAACYSNTRAAMLFAERYHDLGWYARLRGMTEDEIRDLYLSDVGLDDKGGKRYDLGNQTVTARLQNDLSFLIELPDGRTMKSLPKKGADPAKYESSNADFSEMKKDVKKIFKARNNILFEEFLSGRTRDAEGWKKAYLNNVILRKVASSLVWAQNGKTFTLADQGAIDSEENGYVITKEPICLAHPMEMEEDDVRRWQKYFTSHSLKQAFSQIWEPVCDLDQIGEDRYAGVAIPYYRFVGQGKHGIVVYDQDFHSYIEASFSDCDAEINRIDYHRHWIDMDDRFEIKTIKVRRKSRMANHIIAYFDKVTIWGRVRNDDVSIMNFLGDFTMAQISEFIKAAQESEAKNVLAMLLEYNNTAFADFDPMDEFTLE